MISEDEVFKSLKSMEKIKSPDGLSEEFYESFWNGIKNRFLTSIHRAFQHQELNSSQKQSVTKMSGKKDKTKGSLKTGGRYDCLIQYKIYK